jgi:hypothetical protein
MKSRVFKAACALALIATVVFALAMLRSRQREKTGPDSQSDTPVTVTPAETTLLASASAAIARTDSGSEDRLQPLKQNPGSTPPWAALTRLRASDEDEVISLFLSQTNLVNRTSAMAAMAMIGGVKSTDVLWATLTNDYHGSKLSAQSANGEPDQERVLFNAAFILGFISQREE